MRFGGHGGATDRPLSATSSIANYSNEIAYEVTNPSIPDKNPPRYQSCIGTGCSRSPSPIRREFWESNRALPDIVIKRKLLGSRKAEEEKEQRLRQEDAEWGGSRVPVRQGRLRVRTQQSREPLFVYNDASDGRINGGDSKDGREESQISRHHHTPSPRRPWSSHEFADADNLTVEVDVAGNNNEACRIVTENNSGANSPHSLKVSVHNSPRVVVNDSGTLCCPAAACRSSSQSRSPQRSPSCSSPRHVVDRASSPVLIRSRSTSPGVRGGLGQGSVEVQDAERTVRIDGDDEGNLQVEVSTSGENTLTTSPICIPNLAACCRKRNRSATPRCRSLSPPQPCPAQFPSGHNNVEISSDDGDVRVDWDGNDVNVEVDLENSEDCSTPRRVNVRCSRSPPPPVSTRSRSPSRSPELRSPKSEPRSPNSRPSWNDFTEPTSSRQDHPPPTVYESCFHSRNPTPEARTPRKIEIHHRSGESSRPIDVQVDYGYSSESVDSHGTSCCTPQRYVRCSPGRSRCSTPCRSHCSTPPNCRSTASGSRSRSPHCIEICSATPEVPQVTIYRDYLSSNEGSRSRSEPPASVSSRSSSSRITVRRSSSRSATPPKSRTVPTTCVSNSVCRSTTACIPCEQPINSMCCCSCGRGVSETPPCSTHGEHHHHHHHHHPSSPSHCRQLQRCHTPSSPCSSISSTSCYLSINRPPSRSCMSACHSSCHCTVRDQNPEPYCAKFCPAPGDIIIRACQRQPCPHSGKDEGQVEFFSHRSACGLREGDTIVRLGRFDPTGRWCASDVVGMYMLGSHGLWIFLGEEEGHECLRPVQADQHQIVRTINKWLRPRLGDLIIHTVPGPHSFYYWNPKRRPDCNDTRLLLRAFIGIPQVEDEKHNLSCCSANHLPVGYAELYVNVRNHWLFLGRDDHMFTECEITSSS